MAKSQFNVRLPDETLALISRLQQELGVSQADVVRLAVRLLARRELTRAEKSGKNSKPEVDSV